MRIGNETLKACVWSVIIAAIFLIPGDTQHSRFFTRTLVPVHYITDTNWEAFRANEPYSSKDYCAEYLMWFPRTLPMPQPLMKRFVANESRPRPSVSYSVMHDRYEIVIAGPARGHEEGRRAVSSILRALEKLHEPEAPRTPRRQPPTMLASQ